MSLLKLWFIRNPVLVSYSICMRQGSSNLSGSQSALTCLCVCARARLGMREFNMNNWVTLGHLLFNLVNIGQLLFKIGQLLLHLFTTFRQYPNFRVCTVYFSIMYYVYLTFCNIWKIPVQSIQRTRPPAPTHADSQIAMHTRAWQIRHPKRRATARGEKIVNEIDNQKCQTWRTERTREQQSTSGLCFGFGFDLSWV
jgi:hypothetical protein